MNSPIVALRTASILAGLIGLGHLVRLLVQVDVVIGTREFPLWLSGVAVIVAAVLSWWFWRVSLPARESAPAHHEAMPAES